MGAGRCGGAGRVTRDWGWRVRVDASGDVGSGILVDDSHVLTCAHVVSGHARATAVIGGEKIGAEVVPCAHWAQVDDPGDVAVLRLERRTGVRPARFADLNALHHGRVELGAFGFPHDKENVGSIVTLNSRRDMGLQEEEWWQLDVDAAHLEAIRRGFSGAAVYLLDSDLVVGMLSDTDRRLNGLSGRMLPLSSIRRYWQELDDHIPFGWLERESRRELRRLLAGIRSAPKADALVESAFPFLQSERSFSSLWEAVSYVGEQLMRDEAIAHFMTLLVRHVDGADRRRLADWMRRWMPEHLPRGESAPPASVIVRVDRRRDRTELTIESLVDGEPAVRRGPVAIEDEETFREKVEELLPEVCRITRRRDLMFEFALPMRFFHLPFETWLLDREDGIELRSFPVVIRDVKRLDPWSFRTGFALERWESLRARGETAPRPVDCDLPYTLPEYREWIAEEDVGALAYSARPSGDHLKEALSVGMPVMFWPRAQCERATHEACERTLRNLTRYVEDAHPNALPKKVKKLRNDARHPIKGVTHQYGRELTLFWDDPARTPDPPLGMEAT
ncbi:trypsin-like peptidase domain-containing protein [Streptosporangium sp. NPDC051022]|uniref:VMAP-C domain-containing protein n=1 Tax=Streptosporangium sp. NPDC051022 TaxID=3155752 RepID=UPI0034411440